MAPAADRFSKLPDELVVHVISFLPVRDAARTSVLARRWRPLWLHTATIINLDSAYCRNESAFCHYDAEDFIDGERLFADAYAALAAMESRRQPAVRRLSLFMEANSDKACAAALGRGGRQWDAFSDDKYNRLQHLLADPSLRELEEICVDFRFTKDPSLHYILKLNLRPGYLPAAAQNLRVLDLARCCLELPTPSAVGGVSFPRLASVRLVRCSITMLNLEALVRAAPGLTALHIEHDEGAYGICDTDRLLLHCPNLTALTVAGSYFRSAVEVYAPRLRIFSYSGCYMKESEFFMKSAMTNLMEVSLNFNVYYTREEDRELPGHLWKFLSNFRSIKALKLHLLNVEHLVVDEGVMDEHEPLPVLHMLERLELEASVDGDSREDSATAIATLLRQCPVIRYCHLRFSERYSRRRKETDARSEFEVSVDLFNMRESKEIAGLIMLEDDGDDSSSVPDLPGLTGCWFSCLQNHLKYVKLQFEMKRMNCFEVCLAKFFAENCKVLEVLQIEDGEHNFLSHVDRKVERWRLNALKQSDLRT